MKLIKWFVFISIVAAGIWLTTSLLGDKSGKTNQAVAAPEAQAMPVKVATLQTQEINQWHDFSGKLVAVDTVEIRPRVGGAIEEVYFQPGSIVEAGKPLFLIDPRPYQAEVNRAAAAVTAAKAQAELANSVASRADRLIKENAIAKRDFDERKNGASVASANIKSAEAALQQAKLNLDYATVKAPITGKISRAEITKGNVVEAGPNAPVLASMVSIKSIYADFDVDEQTYLNSVRKLNAQDNTTDKGVPVNLTLNNDAAATTYHGEILAFDNRLDPSAGTIRARAIFENSDEALIPGMFAKVHLGSSEKKEVVLIPDRIVNTDQDKKFVYIVNAENKAEYRAVTLGEVNENMRIVLDGLKPGDKVILNNLLKLRPDTPVQPTEAPLVEPVAAAEAAPAAEATAEPAKTEQEVPAEKADDASTLQPIDAPAPAAAE